MSDTIAGLPFWQLTFDKDGDTDKAATSAVVDEIASKGITDLVVFSHGWNNSQDTARRLYTRFFETMAPQLAQATRPTTVGLVGVFWPSQRWSDEPIPDFAAQDAQSGSGGGGAAGLDRADDDVVLSDPSLDAQTLDQLKELFPAGAGQLDRMAELLAGEPTADAARDFLTQMQDFAAATAEGSNDGEGETPSDSGAEPRMLEDGDAELFQRYVDGLGETGVVVEESPGGAAGIGSGLAKIWHGAKEALRQLTYWQMKNRAGVVGKEGLGPFVGRLNDAAAQVRVHLVGHSFGARVVSYALAGLPDSASPSPVKSVTLLQGAFSHYAFADPHPFDANRKGALAGRMSRIDGPLTACFSRHDGAVGIFYPLASMAARDDSAAAIKPSVRWGGMGADGAQGVDASLVTLQPAGGAYPFDDGKALNIDASAVVKNGAAPTGAHSDIVHPELTWLVLSGGRIVG
jgi:hypothetical protein